VEQTPYEKFLEYIYIYKKKISIDLMLLQTWRVFFGRGEDGVFHCEDCCYISGSFFTAMIHLNEVLKHAKNRKSCGLDNLPMEMWKFGGNELKIHLLELFNKIIEKNQVPQEWETGMVINIHKKGTKSKCEHYRGIALLPTAYKLFANIIKKTD